jgi:hypothetical protein
MSAPPDRLATDPPELATGPDDAAPAPVDEDRPDPAAGPDDAAPAPVDEDRLDPAAGPDDAAPAPVEPPPPDAGGPGWRGRWVRAISLPLLVMLPLIGAVPLSDSRYNAYRFGGAYAQRPWELLTDPITSIPRYLDYGNFRPLGRLLERGLDAVAYAVSSALTMPLATPLRLIHLAAIAVLVVVVVLLAETVTSPTPLRSGRPSAATALVPLTLATTLVASGRTSSVIVFTDLYALSTALVLGIAAVAARHAVLVRETVRRPQLVGAILVGAALPIVNEVAYLAVPLAWTAAALRGRLTLRRSWSELASSAAAALLLAGSIAFAAVFLPLRIMLAIRCADGSCYDGSDVSLGWELLPTFGHRLVSWVPTVGWYAATRDAPTPWYLPSGPVAWLLLAAIVVVAWRLLREGPSLRQPTGRQVLALAGVGAAILLMVAALVALSADVQGQVVDGWAIGSGWRDTLMAGVGGAVLLAAVLLAPRLVRRPGARGVALGLLVLLAVGTALANQGQARGLAARPDAALHMEIAVAVTNFLPNEEADDRRCALFARFVASIPDQDHNHRRMEEALNATTQARFGQDFCSTGIPEPTVSQ